MLALVAVGGCSPVPHAESRASSVATETDGRLPVLVRERSGAVADVEVRIDDVASERVVPDVPRARFPDGTGATQRTDASGRAVFEGLARGPWRVWAGRPGWAHVFSAPVEADAGEVAPVTGALPPEQRIAGRVRSFAHWPVEATVTFVPEVETGEGARTRTDPATGEFELWLDAPHERGGLMVDAATRHGLASVFHAPVAAGDDGVEVALPPARSVTVETRAPDGTPIAGGVVFERRAFDRWLREWPGPRQDGHRHFWSAPETPVRLTASAARHDTLVRELAPAELPSTLVLTLEPLRAVRGVVTHAGRPVAGASVVLLDGERPRTDPAAGLEALQWSRGEHGRATTDAEGRFSLALGHSGTFWVRAFARGHGAAEVGPLRLEQDRGETGLVVELDQALGTMEGTVHLPHGRSIDELSLQLCSDVQDDLLVRPAPWGRFRVRDLSAGRWTVRVVANHSERGEDVDGELARGLPSHWVPSPPAWIDVDRMTEVALAPGATERVVVDLAKPPACTLVCSLLANGQPLSTEAWDAGWYGMGGFQNLASLQREDRGAWEPSVSEAQLDGSGTFRLGTDEAGVYRLDVLFTDGDGSVWRVLDRVRLERGVRDWTLDVVTGALRVLPDAQGEGPRRPRAFWRGPGERRVFVSTLEAQSDGSVVLPRVPAGAVSWVDERDGERVVLGRVDVPVGGTATLVIER